MEDLKKQVEYVVKTLEGEDNLEECPECGEDFNTDGYCSECGHPSTESGWSFLNDALDIEWVVASDRKTLIGASVLVAFGGPSIKVNTRTKTVEGWWWSDKYSASYEDTIGLDDALEDLWACG